MRRAMSPRAPSAAITSATVACGCVAAVRRGAPTSHRFSSTVRPFITDGTCVLMPTPRRTISCGAPAGHVLAADEDAAVGCWSSRICPVRHLKNVLLPAPFGPIRQRSSRSRSAKLTLLTAMHAAEAHRQVAVSTTVSLIDLRFGVARMRARARRSARPLAASLVRRLRRCSRSRRAHAARGARATPAPQRRQDAARQQQHDEDQDRAEHQRVVDQRLLAEQQLQRSRARWRRASARPGCRGRRRSSR